MSDTINRRIKQLRKDMGLTQGEFGKKIGLKHGAVSKMEQDGSRVIDQNIKLICDVFGVNEQWLRHGEGQRNRENGETVLKQLALEYNLTGERLELVKNFLMLTVEQQEAIVRSASIIAEANKKALATKEKK